MLHFPSYAEEAYESDYQKESEHRTEYHKRHPKHEEKISSAHQKEHHKQLRDESSERPKSEPPAHEHQAQPRPPETRRHMEEAAPREPSPHRRHERRIERYYVGVNFPGVNAGMFFTDKVAAELRAQYLSKVFVGGGRLYIYPEIGGFHARDIRVYFGAEADFISAKGEVSEGNGFAMEAFGGMEYYFSRALSFMFDIGPAYVTIHDRSTALSSDGLHFVLNSSINYHF